MQVWQCRSTVKLVFSVLFLSNFSDVFPTSCVNENKKGQENFGNENKVEFSLGIRRIQSTVEFVTNNNQEDCCLDQKCVIDEQPTPTKVNLPEI